MSRLPPLPSASGSSTAEAEPCTQAAPQELQQGDFYLEGPSMVFTAQYHLRRGFCCNSGCRHCPYQQPA